MTWITLPNNAVITKGRRKYYSAIPVVPCVYVFFNRDAVPIYVGQTTSLQARYRQHRPAKLGRVKYKIIPESWLRADLERRLILRLQPEKNVVHTDNRPSGGRLFQFSRRHW